MTTENKKFERTVPAKRVLAHCTVGIGQNLTFTFWSGYITMFYTDILGLTLGAVTSLSLIARLWDAINDPLMGVVSDRTRTKWGKFRPWLLFAAGPIALFLILSFTNPGFTGNGKLMYAWFTYLGMTTAFTLLDVPFWTMPAAYTEDTNERTGILSKTRLTTTITGIIGSLSLPWLIKSLGRDNRAMGFLGVAIMIAVIGTVCRIIGFFGVREMPGNEQLKDTPKEKFNFSKTFKVLTCNKPLMQVVIAGTIINGILMLSMNSQTYFALYCLGDLGQMSILQFFTLPGVLVGLLLITPLSKRFGKKYTFITVNIFLIIVYVLFFFAGYQNRGVLYFFMFLKSIPDGINMVLVSSAVADTIEYAEWKTGDRSEGLISSSQTFMANIGLAIAGGCLPMILSFAGYVPNVEQSAHTQTIIFAIQSLLPAIGLAIGIIPMFFYQLTEKRHAEIVAELDARKKENQHKSN